MLEKGPTVKPSEHWECGKSVVIGPELNQGGQRCTRWTLRAIGLQCNQKPAPSFALQHPLPQAFGDLAKPL